MKNIRASILNSISDHIKALELCEKKWFSSGIKTCINKNMIYYGQSFLTLNLVDGTKLEFSYVPSEQTMHCNCKHADPQFNIHYNCCGVNCDWERPMVIKYDCEANEQIFIYTGLQKDLWEISL